MNREPAVPGGRGCDPLAGDWTIYRAAELQPLLQARLAEGADSFDLAGVTEIDSCGLQLLLAARRSAAAAGVQARFLNAPEAVRELCRTFGVRGLLEATGECEAP